MSDLPIPEQELLSGRKTAAATLPRLIIADMHHKYERTQAIIDAVPHSGVVFLGDYWDDFHDTVQHAIATAHWVRNRMEKHPEDKWLLGNHDIHYLYGVCQCSGFTPAKHRAIMAALTTEFMALREQMKLFTYVDGWLLTHAGLSNGVHPAEAIEDLPKVAEEAMIQMRAGNSHYLVEAGKDRGGWRRLGGLTWCDYRRFEPIPGVKQAFGHTPDLSPRQNGDNWCIDTHLNHYALIRDGVLTVHPVSAIC